MAVVNYGPHLNKLVVIVDILDQSRVLVDGPTSGMRRQVMNVKRLAITSIKVDGLERGAAVDAVKSAYEAAKVDETFAASGWGKKIDRKAKRAALDDFGRFKVMCARIQKGKKVREEVEKLKAAA